MKYLLVLLCILPTLANPDISVQHASRFRFRTLNMHGKYIWERLGTEISAPLSETDNRPTYDIVALQGCPRIPEKMEIIKSRFVDTTRRVNYKSSILPACENQVNVQSPSLKEIFPTTLLYDSDRRDCHVSERKWPIKDNVNYYYYDLTCNKAAGTPMNLAIASYYQADEVIVFMESEFMYKPVLGIRKGSRFFVSVQALTGKRYIDWLKILEIEKELRKFEVTSTVQTSWVIMGTSSEDMSLSQKAISPNTQRLWTWKTETSDNIFSFVVVSDQLTTSS